MNTLYFISGTIMTTFAASGFFFLKFYRASGDRFFCFFAIACWLLGLERVALLLFEESRLGLETSPLEAARSFVYLIRLLAFLIILYAIIDKNKKGASS